MYENIEEHGGAIATTAIVIIIMQRLRWTDRTFADRIYRID